MEQAFVNGAMLALNYALIALGITLIFSIMSILNFAHGQMFMLGGFVVYYLYARLGLFVDEDGFWKDVVLYLRPSVVALFHRIDWGGGHADGGGRGF